MFFRLTPVAYSSQNVDFLKYSNDFRVLIYPFVLNLIQYALLWAQIFDQQCDIAIEIFEAPDEDHALNYNKKRLI